MKRCAKCGRTHTNSVMTCDCGHNLPLESNEEKKINPIGTKAKSNGHGYGGGEYRSYPALQTVGAIYGVIGWLILIAGVLAGVFLASQAFRYQEPGMGDTHIGRMGIRWLYFSLTHVSFT